VTHANVAFDVESRRSREPEGLHVSKDLSLEQAALRPGTSEPADQLVIDRTSVLIDQLDALVAAVVRVAIVHDDVEAVCKENQVNPRTIIQSNDDYFTKRHEER